MKKKSFKKTIVEDELSFEEDFDESGFDVAPLGTQVSSFSFCSDAAEVDKSNNTDFNNNTKDILFTKQANKKSLDNRYGKPTANGAAPLLMVSLLTLNAATTTENQLFES